MPQENAKISIIAVNWNTRDLLRKCLKSIFETVPPISFEAIVVDNASSDNSAEMVAEEFPEVTLIRSDKNLGFSAGNNLGIKKASGDYILLLNPDAELLPNSAQAMLDFAESNPKVGVLGPKLLNSDGSLQKNGRTFTNIFREILGLTKLYHPWAKIYPKADWGRTNFDAPAQVDEISGACFFVRKSVVDSVGMLDERFFMYYEEVDWCRRIKVAGWEVQYLPSAMVTHHWSQGAKKSGLRGSHIAYQSQYRYFKKHYGLFQAVILRGISALVLAALHVKHGIRGKP